MSFFFFIRKFICIFTTRNKLETKMDIYKENDFYVKLNRKEIKLIDTVKLRKYIKNIFKESEVSKQEDLLWDLIEEFEKDRVELALFVRQTAKVFTEDLQISRT